MPDKFFFEQVADNKRESYKIFVFLLIAVTAAGGVAFYFVYTAQIENNPMFIEARCGFEEAGSRDIGGGAKDVAGVQELIGQAVDEPKILYLSLKPTEQCGNEVGMWFNNQDGSRMYAYCLGLSKGKLIRFERSKCSSLDHGKAVSDSFDSVVNATRGK
ncbi:MAG: hypothetical protein HY833_03205 [Candidatus Aenigmarchaeota archaeon]|nr:hypothetical protein [Candidatus Aenigmarchaeota archaeon]